MIPGSGDTLRVGGTGAIASDRLMQDRLAVNGRTPALLLVVTVEQAFMHCAKALRRSNLWYPDRWPDRADVPSLAEAMVSHGALPETQREMNAIIERDGKTRMY